MPQSLISKQVKISVLLVIVDCLSMTYPQSGCNVCENIQYLALSIALGALRLLV